MLQGICTFHPIDDSPTHWKGERVTGNPSPAKQTIGNISSSSICVVSGKLGERLQPNSSVVSNGTWSLSVFFKWCHGEPLQEQLKCAASLVCIQDEANRSELNLQAHTGLQHALKFSRALLHTKFLNAAAPALNCVTFLEKAEIWSEIFQGWA